MTEMYLDFEKYTRIVHELLHLPQIRATDPTFFEITGYPSLENVTSNILKFFFDPTQAHGLDTLFLEALLKSIKAEYLLEELSDVEVNREVPTDLKYRIDLVLESQNFIIGIENKLFANLNNDLDNYHKYLTGVARGKRVITILLSLFPMDSSKLRGHFISLTYNSYFDRILEQLGGNILNANNRYISFFLEFIKTIKNLREAADMVNPAFIEWLAKNQDDVNYLYQQIAEFKKELTNKAKKLGSLVSLQGYIDAEVKISQWVWDAFHYGEKIITMDLVHDINTKDFQLAIDTMISASGIYMMLSNRHEKDQLLRTWLKANNVSFTPFKENAAVYGKQFKYNESVQVVQKQLQELLDKLLRIVVEEKKNK